MIWNVWELDGEDETDFINHIQPHVNLTEDDLEVLDFNSLESDQEDVPENAKSRGLRKLRKKHTSSGIRNNFYIGKEFANKDLAKESIRAYAVEKTRNLDFKKVKGYCVVWMVHYVGNKMHKAFPLPGIEFLLEEEVSTASEEGCHCQKKREATAREIALLSKSRRNCQSKSNDSFTNTASTTTTDTTSSETGKKSGRTVTLTVEDMQNKKNDVKARTTLLLSLPDEHQLLFSKYKTARELWAAILKTFDGNEATKKTKKNLLKQQYGNFKAEGSETLEQTFNRLQRNMSDLDTMSLDDLYNNLKVYESEVQKKSKPNSQNMAFISSAKHSSGNEDGNTACVPTASTNVPTASVATINQDTAWKKISIQGSDVVGFDKSKVECFNCHKMGHFARERRAPKSQDRGRRDNYRQGSKAEEQAPKALMAIDGVGWDWSYMANDEEDHALKLKTLKQENEGVDGKLAGLLTASKDLDNLIESQRADKNNEELVYNAVPPPPAQIYSSPKKDLSWTDLPELSPTMKSTSGDDQNRNPSVSETVASPITPKPFIKFMKPKVNQSK
nr:ribonuclease H-like domain-containing protein [Tanacetum cinerariifolium]